MPLFPRRLQSPLKSPLKPLLASLVLALGLPCQAQPRPSQEAFSLVLHPEPGPRWEWVAAERGELRGPSGTPYRVPEGQVLLVDRIQVILASVGARLLGWSIPVVDRRGEPWFTIGHHVTAQMPDLDTEAPVRQLDALGFEPAVVLRAGSGIQAPCPTLGTLLWQVNLSGRLVPLPAAASAPRSGTARPAPAPARPEARPVP